MSLVHLGHLVMPFVSLAFRDVRLLYSIQRESCPERSFKKRTLKGAAVVVSLACHAHFLMLDNEINSNVIFVHGRPVTFNFFRVAGFSGPLPL